MFAKNSKAYSVYLLFRFVFSLAVSMSTVLSIVCTTWRWCSWMLSSLSW